MIWISHVIFSSLFTISLLNFFGSSNKEIFFYVIFSSIASLLPDIDTKSISRNMLIGKIFYWIFFFPFAIVGKKPKHRGVTHTLLFLIALAMLCFVFQLFLGMQILFISILAGYFSHIVLDGLTKEGVRPYAPMSMKRISGPIKVGSWFEYLFDIFMIASFIFLEIFSLERFFSLGFLIYFCLRSII